MIKLLLFTIMFSSCSNMEIEDRSMESVGLKLRKSRIKPQIERSFNQIQIPTINHVDSKINNPRTPILMVEIGPGLEHTIGFVPIIQELVKKKIRVHYVMGHGLGAVIAAMFAMGMSESRMEWSFYKFMNKKKQAKAFSDEWYSVLKRYLLKNLNDQRSETLKVGLLIPTYGGTEDYYHRGNVVNLLLTHLQAYSRLDRELINYRPDLRKDATLQISLRIRRDFEEEEELIELEDNRKHLTFNILVEDLVGNENDLPAYLQRCKLRAGVISKRIDTILANDLGVEQRVVR